MVDNTLMNAQESFTFGYIYVVLSQDGQILSYQTTLENVASEHTPSGSFVNSVVHPDDRQRFEQALQMLGSKGEAGMFVNCDLLVSETKAHFFDLYLEQNSNNEIHLIGVEHFENRRDALRPTLHTLMFNTKANKQQYRLNVLYVEDDKEIRHNFTRLLSSLGCSVIEAEDGAQALQLFYANRVDFIITDIMMPQIDGIDMIRKLRDEESDVPIIITSAYDDKPYLMKAIDLDVTSYLEKPFNLHDLLEVLDKVDKLLMVRQAQRDHDQVLHETLQKLKNPHP